MKLRLLVWVPAVSVFILIGCVGAQSATRDAQSTQAVEATSRAAKMQPANLTRAALKLPGNDETIVTAFGVAANGDHGSAGTIQPGVGVWNGKSGVLLADRQINIPPNGNYTTAAGSTAGHDSPALVEAADGSVLVVYGAASTYSAYDPPEPWSCLAREFCEPFKYAPAANAHGSSIASALAESSEYHLPSIGLSEASYATLGDTSIIAGQQQPNSPNGQGGAQGYVSFHARPGGGRFDTAAGPWDFRSSEKPAGDGLEMLTRAPNDDAYFDFGITADAPGNASVAVSVGDLRCGVSVQSSGSAAQDAAETANRINAGCPEFDRRFGATQVKYDPVLRLNGAPLAPAAVGITARRDNASSLPSGTQIAISCSGSISCGTQRGENTVDDVRSSGLHRHFLWGGVIRSGPYIFYLMDLQQVTGSWDGPAGNSYAISLACFRTTAPTGAVWTWSDCSGRHPFHVSPGTGAPDRLSAASPYLLPTPKNVLHNGMLPYIDDFSMSGQLRGRGGYPVLSAESAAVLPDGTLMVAHGCQTASNETTVCALQYNMHTGATVNASAIDRPAGGGSLASIALRVGDDGVVELGVLAGEGDKWGCGASGICAMVYRYDNAQGRWSRELTRSIGGSGNAGFPGTLSAERNGFVVSAHILRDGESKLQVLELP